MKTLNGKKPHAPDIASWAKNLDASEKDVTAAWADLNRRKLANTRANKLTISAEAMLQANSDIQRRLASYLSGYELTENSYIVKKAGAVSGSPAILNTRITVEYIANYFREGWGVSEIRRDLPQLTPAQIEAAIQYYLNHREEIEREIGKNISTYEENTQIENHSGVFENPGVS